VRRGDHDLVHTHNPVSAVVASAASHAGTPLVHTEHNRFRAPTRLQEQVSTGQHRLHKRHYQLDAAEPPAALLDWPMWPSNASGTPSAASTSETSTKPAADVSEGS
jgi:hypothetical protein